jgi:hypothetical protein
MLYAHNYNNMNSINVSAPKSRGLGDTIAKITKAIGIKPCKNCSVNVGVLNKKYPYKQ